MRCGGYTEGGLVCCTRWIRAFRVLFLSFAFFSVNAVLCWLGGHDVFWWGTVVGVGTYRSMCRMLVKGLRIYCAVLG